MIGLEGYLDRQLAQGRGWFTAREATAELRVHKRSFIAAAERLAGKGRLLHPRRGFYLILRPQDKCTGVPDPARWIDPLLKYLQLDYRISLLRAAAFHGSSHQAAIPFQIIVPKQLPHIVLGCHRVEFFFQAPAAFRKANNPEWLVQLKSSEGFARIAGTELTMLDCTRYYHRVAGINGTAHVVDGLGAKASPRILRAAAQAYQNSTVRRLGFLLERFAHERGAAALRPFAAKAKSFKDLDPSARQVAADNHPPPRNERWKLIVNEPRWTDG
jgi:hypothetical protein